MTPFWIIHNQYLTISYQMTPLFDNISLEFHIFLNLSKKCPICILPGNFAKWCLILTFWPPFLVFSLNDPHFWRKISYWKTPHFETLTEHPHHFQSWVPPPSPKLSQQCLKYAPIYNNNTVRTSGKHWSNYKQPNFWANNCQRWVKFWLIT